MHVKLGIAGAVLAGIIIALGVYTGIVAGKLGHAPPGAPPPIPFMAGSIKPIVACSIVAVGQNPYAL